MKPYSELKAEHQKQFNEIPIKFAFNIKQLNILIEEFGVPKNELCQVADGGFMKKVDIPSLEEFIEKKSNEMNEAFSDYFPCSIEKDNLVGEYVGAMVYELNNHEYCYTGSTREAMEALGIDKKSERVTKILKLAVSLAYCEE